MGGIYNPPTSGGASVPSGTILSFGGTVAPAGYLACDGTAINRVANANLFTAIGITWGAGDGINTFNLPSFARRTPVGSGGAGSGTLGNAVGNTGGEETHILTTPEIANHSHTQFGTDGTAGGATAPVIPVPGSVAANVNIATGTAGGGGAHNNIQPSAVVLMIIKT